MVQTEIERFITVTDSGHYVEIIEVQHWVSYRPLKGEARLLEGSTEMLSADGRGIIGNADGSFTIVASGEVLRRYTEGGDHAIQPS